MFEQITKPTLDERTLPAYFNLDHVIESTASVQDAVIERDISEIQPNLSEQGSIVHRGMGAVFAHPKEGVFAKVRARNRSDATSLTPPDYEFSVFRCLQAHGARVVPSQGVFVFSAEKDLPIRTYLFLDFFGGRTLDSFSGRFAPDALLNLFCQEVAYINCLDRLGLVDYDYKPENIFADSAGSTVHFDLECVFSPQQYHLCWPDQKGSIVGTPDYMSPQRLQGFAVDISDQVFVFGILFAEAVCGKHPFLYGWKPKKGWVFMISSWMSFLA